MGLVKKFEKSLRLVLERFELLQKSDKLSVGGLDSEVKKLIVGVFDEMIKNYSDDELYFSLVEFLSDLVYAFSDYKTGYRIWLNISLDKLNNISSGVKDELEFLEEIKSFYLS